MGTIMPDLSCKHQRGEQGTSDPRAGEFLSNHMESEESWSSYRENRSGELVIRKTNRYDGNAPLATGNRIEIPLIRDLITADHLYFIK